MLVFSLISALFFSVFAAAMAYLIFYQAYSKHFTSRKKTRRLAFEGAAATFFFFFLLTMVLMNVAFRL
jgi:hypothetical protein